MKLLIILSALVVLVFGQGTYTTENDDLDIDAIVSSPEKLQEWFSCFVDKGACSKVQSSFKADMPEAIREACGKCTAAQKEILKKFLAGLEETSPANFEEYKKKFDPENKYFAALKKAIA
uniref:Chemosensory Protein n=1 Tax=Epiphyas postvittana TaxID=65032 RepID=A0A0K8TUS3_EPIPO